MRGWAGRIGPQGEEKEKEKRDLGWAENGLEGSEKFLPFFSF